MTLKEAIEAYKKELNLKRIEDCQCEKCLAIKTIIAHAQATLDCPEGWPEKRDTSGYTEGHGYGSHSHAIDCGFNAALDLCRQARAREIAERPRVEDIKQIIINKELTPTVCNDSGRVEWSDREALKLAQAIHARLEKGK
jgi:hypothetical protein